MRIIVTILAMAVAACSNGSDAGTADGKAGAGDSGAPAMTAQAWDATQACAALPAAEAAAIVGSEVTSAELTPMSQKTDTLSAVSMCTYNFASGAMMTVLLRDSPVDDATPEAIEKARTTDGTLSPARDITGLGKAALWSNERKQMQAFLDDRRLVVVNLFGIESTGLEEATAAVRAVM